MFGIPSWLPTFSKVTPCREGGGGGGGGELKMVDRPEMSDASFEELKRFSRLTTTIKKKKINNK